jgi:hypothetical protein
MDITIWRLGDGHVLKSDSDSGIKSNEVLEHTFVKPGTYTFGYSIIDGNDFSDEATCTVTFADPNDKESKDRISEDCGKSPVGYNSQEALYNMNVNRRSVRNSIIMIVSAGFVMAYTLIFVKKKEEKK